MILEKQAIVDMLAGHGELINLLLVSTLLGLLIAYVYRITHRGFSYSQSFGITIILVSVITTLIIILINDSVATAIAIFGAFSIIRFRTAIKDVRDIAFILFALATGLAIGVKSVLTGIIGVSFISLLICILYKTNFGGLRKFEYVLNFKIEQKNHSQDLFKKIMSEYLKKQLLLNIDAGKIGGALTFTFNITFKNDVKLDEFVTKMMSLKGISDVSVISSKNDLEF